MKNDLFIGIDIGTTVSKGVVINWEGTVLASHQLFHDYKANIDYALCWWEEVRVIIFELLKKLENKQDVTTITVSAMVPNLIFIGQNGDLACETKLFTDGFAIDEQVRLDNLDGTKWKNETLSKLIVLKERIDKSKVCHLLTTHSYIAYKLAGQYYCDLPSAYEYGNVFDESCKNWNVEVLKQYGLDHSILPQIVSPITCIGTIKEGLAKEFGISTDVKILAGSQDSVASMIGAGLFNKKDNLIYYGTFNSTAVLHEDIINILLGDINCMPIEWTSSIPDSGPQFAQMCELLTFESDYDLFEREAKSSIPGANGVIFLQTPQLLRTSISSTRDGAFHHISRSARFKDLCRAVYESLGYGINAFWLADGFSPEADCFAAGGGTRSDFRVQVTSDILMLSQIRLENAENAVGTALIGIAATDMQQFRNIQAHRKSNAKVYVPKRINDTYDAMKELYKSLLY